MGIWEELGLTFIGLYVRASWTLAVRMHFNQMIEVLEVEKKEWLIIKSFLNCPSVES